MNNYYNAYQQPNYIPQYQQIQQMFPQPQGSVYSINSPGDIGNVPIGSTGLSVVLCLNDDIMYIKSFQNGSPVIMAYKVLPYQKDETQSTAVTAPVQKDTTTAARLDAIETKLNELTKGGKFDGLI